MCFYLPQAWGGEAVASREYGPNIKKDYAVVAARAAASLEALEKSMRTLAQSKIIRFAGANDGTVSFLPPNFEGLVRYLNKLSLEELPAENNEIKEVRILAKVEFINPELNLALVEALKKPDLMDRYGALNNIQAKALKDYDIIASALLERDDPTGFSHKQLAKAVSALKAVEMVEEILLNYQGVWLAPEKEAKKLEEAMVQGPDNPLILGSLAELYIQQGKSHEARELVDKALELGPFYPFLHDIKGVILLRQHLPALAADAFTETIKLSPKNPMYRMHRASAYLVQGDQDAMCKDFRTACVLGDCTGYQWAREGKRCFNDGGTMAKSLEEDLSHELEKLGDGFSGELPEDLLEP